MKSKDMTHHCVRKGCRSCCVPHCHPQHFVSCASSASFTQTMQIPFSLAFFTCSHPSEFRPLSFSFLLSFTAREVKPQPHEAISICSNPCSKCLPHHVLLLHHLLVFICQFICPQGLSPAALRVPISRHFFISPQGFNTLFSSSLQHLSLGILIKLPD